jgi:transcriptional regulator of acetoin/glycerol metabolism
VLGPAERDSLIRYSWPGNVRELKHVVEAMVLATPDGRMVGREVVRSLLEERASRDRSTSNPARQRIEEAVQACGGNRTQAAKMLGISRKTLYRRLQCS